MKIKNLLLVCSLFLAGGVVATAGEQANNVREVAAETASLDLPSLNYNNQQNVNGVEIKIGNVASVTFNKGSASTNPTYYTSGTAVRVYAKSNFVVKSQYTLTKITLTYGTSDKTNAITTDVGSFSTNTWTGESKEVTFTIGGTKDHRRIKGIAVEYSLGDSSVYTVSFDANPSAFIDGKGADVTGTAGTTTEITLPSENDLVDAGYFDNGLAKVTGWQYTAIENEEEVVKTLGFGEVVSVEGYTQFETTHTRLKTDISISEAVALGESVTTESEYAYSCSGIITSIDTAYSSTFNNITVTIDDGENSIECFRLSGGEDLYVGTNIKVTGKVALGEFVAGSTYTILEQASASDLFVKELTTTKLTAAYDSEVLLEESGTYSYEFGSQVFNAVNQTKILNNVNWTTAGTSATGAHSYNYDSNNGRGQQFGTSTNYYTVFTLTSADFNGVNKIVLNAAGASSTNAKLTVTVGGVQIGETVSLTSAAAEYTFTADQALSGEVQLSYTQTSQKALYLKSISIDYSAQEKSYTVADASVGFASLIDAAAYDENANYGILVVPTEELGSNTVASYVSTDVNALVASLTAANVRVANYPCEPVKVDANGDADENGEFYQFGVLFSNCLANIDFSLTAVAYMEVNGQVYLTSNQSSYSLRSLAQAYIDAGTMAGNPDAAGVLEAIVNY